MGVHETFHQVLTLEGQAILACSDRLSKPKGAEQVRDAIEILKAALEAGGKIIVTGVGKSGKVAQKIAATLSSTGSLAVFLHPTEGLHGDLGVVRAGDAILALSYTGNTEELVRLMPPLKALGVKVVSICGSETSQLAQLSDACIDAAVAQEACPHNLAPTTSTTLALALGDALAIVLMQLRGFDASAFAKFHPGGSLGRRLSLHVRDVMHAGDAVGTIAPHASIDDVVDVLTRTKLGGILVTEGRRLLGIITEGDLRRAFSHREKLFSMKAEDVMSRKPTVARAEMMAFEALELMENRPSQISVLPVVDENGNWSGLLRLHDLVKIF